MTLMKETSRRCNWDFNLKLFMVRVTWKSMAILSRRRKIFTREVRGIIYPDRIFHNFWSTYNSALKLYKNSLSGNFIKLVWYFPIDLRHFCVIMTSQQLGVNINLEGNWLTPSDRPFYIFRASKSVTRRSWTTLKSPISWSWDSEVVKRPVGY